jgi:hypothetical protein
MTFDGDAPEQDELFTVQPREAGSTLYAVAGAAMADIIKVYLQLAERTDGFNKLSADDVTDVVERRIVLGGVNSPLDEENATAQEVVNEWARMQAIPFSVENAVTRGVYIALRARVTELLEEMERETGGFTHFDIRFISENAYLLPVFQRLLNITSKAKLKEAVGTVSDNAISRPAAARLAELLNARMPGRTATVNDLRLSIEPTLEGIVRDLVGRVLLENVVANALDAVGVAYKRESEYSSIKGVIYDFRADFVLPNETDPLVFIEVRKSSSRHASLYAKDKMFSAINWKGQNKKMMAILVTEGPWTEQTLHVMTKVFDYVIPLRKVAQMAEIVAAYVDGDDSQLRLVIDFSIRPAH